MSTDIPVLAMKTSEQKDSVERYPKDFPTPPSRMESGKLEYILEHELTDWKIVRSPLPEDTFITREELYREYIFSDFEQVLEFMNKVAKVCNILPHHPRWENTWTTLKVYLTTWDSVHIITYKDIMLARHMEDIYKEYDYSGFNAHQSIRIEKERRKFFKKLKEQLLVGNLEEAYSKLNLAISGPDLLVNWKETSDLLGGFRQFLHQTRQNRLSIDEIRKKSEYFEKELHAIVESYDYTPKVYFSYAWGGEKEEIVDQLYYALDQDASFEVIRDKDDLKYKGMISEFMKEIGKGNFVIIALSDKYLKSKFCMTELFELYRNSSLDSSQMLEKIFPIKVEDIDLNDLDTRKEYLEHWRKEEKEWRDLMIDLNDDQRTYKRVLNIRHALPDLLNFLADINTRTSELLSKDDFKEIKESILSQVQKLNTSGE